MKENVVIITGNKIKQMLDDCKIGSSMINSISIPLEIKLEPTNEYDYSKDIIFDIKKLEFNIGDGDRTIILDNFPIKLIMRIKIVERRMLYSASFKSDYNKYTLAQYIFQKLEITDRFEAERLKNYIYSYFKLLNKQAQEVREEIR